MSALATAPRPLAPISLRDLRDVDPYPAYEAMRAVGPVVWDEGMTAWLVLSHDGCTFVERREDLFEEPTGTLPGRRPDRRAARLPIARRRRARDAPSLAVACLAPGPHRAAGDGRGPAHRQRPPRPPGRAPDLRAVRGPRPVPAHRGHRARARAARPRRGHARGGQGLDGGGPRLAPHLRRGSRRCARRPSRRPSASTRCSSTRSASAATGPRTTPSRLLWETGREVAPDWSEQDVMDNAKFLFEGGSETTAFLICTSMHRLLELPARPACGDPRRPGRASRASSRRSCATRRSSTCAPGGRPRTWSWPGSRSWPASGSSPSTPPPTATRPAGSGRPSWTPTGRGCGATSPSTSGRATAPVPTWPGWRRPRRSAACGARSRT